MRKFAAMASLLMLATACLPKGQGAATKSLGNTPYSSCKFITSNASRTDETNQCFDATHLLRSNNGMFTFKPVAKQNGGILEAGWYIYDTRDSQVPEYRLVIPGPRPGFDPTSTFAVAQASDGNVVFYDAGGDGALMTAASNTDGHAGAYLQLNDDGTLVVNAPNGDLIKSMPRGAQCVGTYNSGICERP